MLSIFLVKGAQFEPGERPSGGLNYIPGSAGWVAPPSEQEMTNVNSALQQFINGQGNLNMNLSGVHRRGVHHSRVRHL